MELAVQTFRMEPDFVVLHLSGGMTIGEIERLESLVSALLHHGERKLIFELSRIERIDSVGGMALARCFFAAREAGGGLCVASASECIARFFKDTNIDTLTPFHPTVEAACQKFLQERS